MQKAIVFLLVDSDHLPAIWTAANQICARSYFDAALTSTTTDVELASKYTTVEFILRFFETWTLAPPIFVYTVN